MGIGMGINELLKKKSYYGKISHFEFVRNKLIYKIIGINRVKWLFYKTYWKNFNPKLRLKSKKLNHLVFLKQEMIYAEISHLIGFILVLFTVIIILIYKLNEFAIILFTCNIFFNLYPLLLQQKNKKRIDLLIKRPNKNCD